MFENMNKKFGWIELYGCDLHIEIYNFCLYTNSIFVIHQHNFNTSLKLVMDWDFKWLNTIQERLKLLSCKFLSYKIFQLF